MLLCCVWMLSNFCCCTLLCVPAPAARDACTQLVNLADMQKNKILTKFSDTSRCCCWSKDGEHFVAAADDGCVKVFAAAGKVCVCRERWVLGVCFDARVVTEVFGLGTAHHSTAQRGSWCSKKRSSSVEKGHIA